MTLASGSGSSAILIAKLKPAARALLRLVLLHAPLRAASNADAALGGLLRFGVVFCVERLGAYLLVQLVKVRRFGVFAGGLVFNGAASVGKRIYDALAELIGVDILR